MVRSRRDCPAATKVSREKTMANVYIEARPKGRPEGSPIEDYIEDYIVEDYSDHGLATFKTQREAID
jgi:hypothetical protein